MNTNASSLGRRSFLTRAGLYGVAGTALGLIGLKRRSVAAEPNEVTDGDVAILKFLAAAELVEDDLWQQYAELAVGNTKFNAALRKIDPSLIRYIQDDRDDERSHANLINSYLAAIGETPLNLDAFRTLPSAPVQGAQVRGRLTNLTNLTVDTSWYNRYRSAQSPNFGATFPQLVDIVNRPTIPTSNNLKDNDIQAIAHCAAFHFGAIEQGGGSLYNTLLTKVTNLDVLAILASIGPVEIYHFAAFHKSLEGIFPLSTSSGLKFPALNANPSLSQAIFPEPCQTLGGNFPLCSVIRPRRVELSGAVAAATGLVKSGLFNGQPPAFLNAVVALAQAADAATRTL